MSAASPSVDTTEAADDDRRNTQPEEAPMAVKLHRCSSMWMKIDAHPCWKVQKALEEQGIEYEVVTGPLRRGKRDELERLSGQRRYPVIEFEDGEVYRAESKDMAARIRAGELRPTPPASPA
jgi:glutaredoxin